MFDGSGGGRGHGREEGRGGWGGGGWRWRVIIIMILPAKLLVDQTKTTNRNHSTVFLYLKDKYLEMPR